MTTVQVICVSFLRVSAIRGFACQLEAAIDDKAASNGIPRIYCPGFQLIKAGVMLLDIMPANVRQGELDFGAAELPGKANLMVAMDAFNQRFGRGTVCIASAGFSACPAKDTLSSRCESDQGKRLKSCSLGGIVARKQDDGALRQYAQKGVYATHQVATCSERRRSLVTRKPGG